MTLRPTPLPDELFDYLLTQELSHAGIVAELGAPHRSRHVTPFYWISRDGRRHDVAGLALLFDSTDPITSATFSRYLTKAICRATSFGEQGVVLAVYGAPVGF